MAFTSCLVVLLLAIFANVSHGAFREEYISQPLNPIDSFNTRRWQNRYFIDSDDYEEGAPIFIHLGGPDFHNAEMRMEMSHFFAIARDLNALQIYTEHRFYGESRPTPDTSLQSLQYLDTRYALADVANLITHLRQVHGNVPVIAHGYDHGGALAVWLRQRYPTLVNGVWASSASLHARKDFGEYLVNIGESIRKVGGDECYDDTEQAFAEMALHYDQQDFDLLAGHFGVCAPFVPNDPYMEAEFFAFYALYLSDVLRNSHTYGINTMCGVIKDYPTKMEGFSRFMKLVIPHCVQLSAYENVQAKLPENWENPANALGNRQLTYQLCREFGWFRSASYILQPFGQRFLIELFQEKCSMLFGPVFNARTMPQMMANTNEIFGGLSPNVTQVYYTDGDLDAAKTLGILVPYSDEVYVDIIPNYAAGAEILPAEENASDIIRVQARARELITQWIAQASRN